MGYTIEEIWEGLNFEQAALADAQKMVTYWEGHLKNYQDKENESKD